MGFKSEEKFLSKQWFIAVGLILAGSFIMAIGFVYFVSPYKFAPGGVYGIAIVLHHLLGFPIGITALCMDIPLTILGIKILGPRFGWKTIMGFVSLAGFTDLLEHFTQGVALVEGEPLLSAIFGGVMIGVGLGLMFRSKATSGGSDIIAMILNKYTKKPVGQLLIYIDSIIVIIGLIAFKDWKIPLFSWIVIYITGKVIDMIVSGASYHKSVFIISDKYDDIRKKIIVDLNRGGTFIQASGMYNNNDKKIIYTVISRRELGLLKSYIKEIDPKAFISVSNAQEIMGNGFAKIEEEN